MDTSSYPETSGMSSSPMTTASPSVAPMHTLSTAWGRRDVGVETSSVGVVTDPDCLGPCEPGTHVVLEGIVWNETPNGILVVNVTWRGKTYVGTLMDATRHDWAPPRFNDESPTNDLDPRTPKGRGKRGRGAVSTPISESCTVGERRLRKTRGRMGSNNSQASTSQPVSPGRAETQPANKRKGRPPEQDLGLEGPRSTKRGRRSDTPGPDNLIECPEPNCSKKYRHVNGLRYHLTHSHRKNLVFDSEGNMVTESTEEFVKPAPVTDSLKDNGGRASPKVKNGRKAALEAKMANASPRKAELQNDSKASTNGSPRKGSEGQDDGDINNKGKVKKPQVQASDASKKLDNTKKPVVSVSPVVTSVLNIPCVSSIRTAQATVLSPVPAVSIATVTTPTSSADPTKPEQGERGRKASKGNKGVVAGKPVGAAAPMVTRPIMPAPTTLASVTTYPQVTVSAPSGTPPSSSASGLKPIQPKPTILGEPSSVNPALAASLKQMKQESKKPKKKKKDKDKERSGQGHKKDKEHKPHTSVIKATTVTIPTLTHLPGGDTAATASAVALKTGVAPPELHRQTLQPPELDKQRLTPPELQKQQGVALKVPAADAHAAAASTPGGQGQGRPNRPPCSLSLDSPLRPREGEQHDSDDVHSPAYSDISDANDAVPVLENEADVKVAKTEVDSSKVVEQCHSADKTLTVEQGHSAERSLGQPGYPMYNSSSYYPQPPYLTPAVPPAGSPQQKPTLPHPSQGSAVRQTPPPQGKPSEEGNNQPRGVEGDKRDIVIPVSGNKDSERKTPKEVPSPLPSSPSLPPRSSSSQSGKDPQDKSGRGHYPSPGSYGGAYMGAAAGYHGSSMVPGMDPAYHMQLLATNPEYKVHHEKWLREQDRRRREHLEQQKQEAKPVDMSAKSKSGTSKPPQQQQPNLAQSPSMAHSPSMAPSPSGSLASSYPNVRDIKKEPQDRAADLSLKEKQNENRQILKENLELRGQMDSGGREKASDASDSKAILERQRDELQRYYIYQQQRMMEHSRYLHTQQPGKPGSAQPSGSPHGQGQSSATKSQPGQSGSSGMSTMGQPLKGAQPATAKIPGSQGHDGARSQHLSAMEGTSKPHDLGHRAWRGEESAASDKLALSKEGGKYPEGSPLNPLHKAEQDKDKANKNRGQERLKETLPSPGSSKGSEDRRASTGTPSSMPPVTAPYSHYYPHYAAAAGQLAFDPNHGTPAIFPTGMVPYGPNTAAYMHPSQIRFSHPSEEGADKDKSLKVASPGSKPSDGSKALDMLQQRASQLYSGNSRGPSPSSHKIHELKDGAKSQGSAGPDHGRTASPAGKDPGEKGERPKEGTPTPGSSTSGGKDEKGRSSSPPPQRHLHTHHHTHVVGPAYPIYGTFPPVMTSPQGPGTPSIPPHSFLPKS